MKAILEFNLPEDREEYEDAANGWKYKNRLDTIWLLLFKPRHKHGYNNQIVNKLLGLHEEVETSEIKACNELMDEIEQMFLDINKEED